MESIESYNYSYKNENYNETQIKDLMALALNLVQGFRHLIPREDE